MVPAIQPNLISNTRTLAEHEGWIITAFATILLGHPVPWDLPEYVGLCTGFHLMLGSISFAQVRRQTQIIGIVLNLKTWTIKSLIESAFLATIYDRRVHTVDEVVKHLCFNTVSCTSTTPYYIKLFRLRLERCMNGVGHPLELQSCLEALGTVSEQEFIASANDPLLCANLVLLCGTDSDLRPTQDDWTISFKFFGKHTRDSDIARPLTFRTCFQSIDVHLDRELKEMLLEPVANDSSGTSKFDPWLHNQLVNRDHNTG
ncbi:hypothetical protein MVEN_01328200 [Mycena venus]|uniref:Uncharacterized protein n=1 Tax=Mycena venus TaxID=2733690 RepID=A0A8H7CW10_9AGAR|nr:hypothetical protein MVEN_01328200 [Mycena venus]